MPETKEILQMILSWPIVAIISLLILRRPIVRIIDRLIKSDSGKAKVGPIEIKLGKLAEEGQQAVHSLNRINCLMAESRLLELEITEGNFGSVFSQEQRERMKSHIEELKSLTQNLANKANAADS